MANLLNKALSEIRRYYYAVESRLPHNAVLARQARNLYGDGLPYYDILAHLHDTYRFERYLEIGVDAGTSLALSKARANYGVDPAFAIRQPLKGCFSLHRTTSDAFFLTYAGSKFDFIFIDGLHVADQVSKDLFNSLRLLEPNGLIALHDTVPFSRVVASPTRCTSVWAGNVYRALVPYIERSLTNIVTMLAPPTGLSLVKAPGELLSKLDAPLPPSRLDYEVCMRTVLASSYEVKTSSDLRLLLQRFYPPPA